MFNKYLQIVVGVLFTVALLLGGCKGDSKSTSEGETPLAPTVAPTNTVETPQEIETPSVMQSPVQQSVQQSPLPVPEKPVLSGCPDGCFDPTPDCLIKGIVTGTGEKLYYLPDTPGYEGALLLVKYGGRWFCTEEEAAYSGFQKVSE